MQQTNFAGTNFPAIDRDVIQAEDNLHSLGVDHARKTCRILYQQAIDQIKRAERDLGETAAFVAASLTTATAIEAVITVANDKLELSIGILQKGFAIYIGIFLLILIYGFFRGRGAIQRRAQAEKELDRARKGIFLYCPIEEWPKPEE